MKDPGHLEQALVEYRTALQLRPLYRREIVNEVAETFHGSDVLVRAVPDDPEVLGLLVSSLRERTKREEARAVAEHALARFPRNGAALKHLAELALEGKAFEAAQRYAQTLMSVDSGPASWILLGEAMRGMGKPELELPHLQDAHTRFPKDVGIVIALSRAYTRLGQYAEARQVVESIKTMPLVSLEVQAKMHDQLADIDDADGRTYRAEHERKEARDLRGAK
jgi:predicted Zn-dependent protease